MKGKKNTISSILTKQTRIDGKPVIAAYRKTTYYYDVPMKKGATDIKLFTQEKDSGAITNASTGTKNFFSSSLGGELLGLTFEILDPRYKPVKLNPDQLNVLDALSIFRATALLKIELNIKPYMEELLSKVLPPVPGLLLGKGSYADAAPAPMIQDWLPVTGAVHVPVLGLNSPIRLESATNFDAGIKFKTGYKVPDELDTYMLCVGAVCNEYLEVVKAVTAPAGK